ncbi:MAG: glycosyltransferase family 2 protein [Succinivibrio sp.]
MLISIIISTYNRPDALKMILQALDYQKDREFEVIIADDGSRDDTRKLIAQMTVNCSFPLRHVFQEDDGFRLSRIRNLAATKASGEYLIFLDGDCIPRPSFVKAHRMLAQKKCLVAGNRILLSENFTKEVLEKQLPIQIFSFYKWFKVFLRGGINRLHPLIVFPYLNSLRNLKDKWKKARGCNFALFREDYFAVNGCDSNFRGWGYEDSDLAVRLIHSGVSIKSGRYATGVFHLYHHENDRSREKENLRALENRICSNVTRAENGIDELDS